MFILLSSPRCREDIELLNGILPDWESKGLSVTLARPVYELFLERHHKGFTVHNVQARSSTR